MGAGRLPKFEGPEREQPLRLVAWIFGSLIAIVLLVGAADYRLLLLFVERQRPVVENDGGSAESTPEAVEIARKLGVTRIPNGYVIGYAGAGEHGNAVRLISSGGASPDQIIVQTFDRGGPATWDGTDRSSFLGCDTYYGSVYSGDTERPKEFWLSLRVGMRAVGVHRFDCPKSRHRSEYIDLSRVWRRGALYAEGRFFQWDDRPIAQVLQGLAP